MDEIDKFIGYLAEISEYLAKTKLRTREYACEQKHSEAVKKLLDGFSLPKNNVSDITMDSDCDSNMSRMQRTLNHDASQTTVPMHGPNADLQPKKKRKRSRLMWTAEELSKMPFLKDLKYRKTKDGIHQFRYRRNGYKVSFNSKKYEVAKQKAYAFIRTLKGEMINSADILYGKTFGFVAEAWLNLKQHHTAKDTYRTYQGVYYNHIAPTFAGKSVKSILPFHLQPFFNDLFSRQERTCENAKVIMNGVFEYALANRLIPSNPMLGVIVDKHFRTPGKAMTDEQILRFREKMFESGKLGVAYLIILYTGVRGAELPSMTIDWENGTFTVHNAKLKKGQKENSSNLKRTVPIFPGLYALKERIEACGDDWKIKTSTLTCKFCNYWTECTVKDLRHTFSSKAREAGCQNELVNLWTGHLPGKNVTANVYTHFSMDFQKKEAELITNY